MTYPTTDEWEEFLDEVFADNDSEPKMFIYKGILYTPKKDGGYDPPVPEELLKIFRGRGLFD